MYNLLVTSDEDAWEGATIIFNRQRAFEHTSSDLTERFWPFSGTEAIDGIKKLPTIFSCENTATAPPARIGWITEVKTKDGEVRARFRLVPGIEIPITTLMDLAWELDIGNYEMNRTHWAVKDVDLLSVLTEAGVIKGDEVGAPLGSVALTATSESKIQIAPTVFKVPSGGQQDNLASVMMPFSSDFTAVFGAIESACRDAGLECKRADGLWEESEVMQDIFKLIYSSAIVVVDFSRKNPNVMYEAGIAHTLGRQVVPLAQSQDDVPFDLRHHRYLQYLNNAEGLNALRQQLSRRLRTLAG